MAWHRSVASARAADLHHIPLHTKSSDVLKGSRRREIYSCITLPSGPLLSVDVVYAYQPGSQGQPVLQINSIQWRLAALTIHGNMSLT